MKNGIQTTIYLESLGCSKNLVDSEMMLGILQHHRFALVEDPACAEVIIVNTCGFIESAKEESINTILALAEYKKAGSCRWLLATGCLTEKYKEELLAAMPELDGALGTSEYHHIASLLSRLLQPQAAPVEIPKDLESCYVERKLITPSHLAYLKIAEGCSNHCTYCLIPELRGSLKSRSKKSLLAEAELLVAKGVKELVVIAQDTTAYGLDIKGESLLAELLKELAVLPFTWIRLMYCYPGRIDEKLLAVMAANPNICHYLDMPLQHVNNEILRAMGGRDTKATILEKINLIKKWLPDVALRTTFMVGFPGETKKQFDELLDFVKEGHFTWVGAFTYSKEDDTPAALLLPQVTKATKKKRYAALMAVLAELSAQQQQKWLGQSVPVLLEGPAPDMPGWWQGRMAYQAPEVDGVVFVKEINGFKAGEFVKIKIAAADIYDVFGEVEKK